MNNSHRKKPPSTTPDRFRFPFKKRKSRDSRVTTIEPSSPSNSSEQQKLKGLRKLDPGVITEVHNQYYPEVYRFVRYRLSDEVLAEDISSEVFVRMLEAIHSGRGPRTSLRGWLMSTASNLANDHFRRMYRRQTEGLSEDLTSDLPEMAEVVEESEKKEAVRMALGKLTPEQQNVLALRFGAGYSLHETARVVGKKVNAIKQLQFRALAALRRNIGEEYS